MKEINKIKMWVLNGSPNSGKDYLADYLVSKHNFKKYTFINIGFETLFDYFNIDKETFFNLYNNRDTKEVPNVLLKNLSPRGAMIYTLEELLKNNKGKDYIAKETIKNIFLDIDNDIDNNIQNIVISDLGFEEEEETIHKMFKNTNIDYRIIYIDRLGYGYKNSNDIRKKADYVNIIIKNDKNIEEYLEKVELLINNKKLWDESFYNTKEI